MLRLLKQLFLAFKPISDAEAMQMNLNGPQPPKREQPEIPHAELERDGSIRVKPDAVWDRFDQGPGQHGNWG